MITTKPEKRSILGSRRHYLPVLAACMVMVISVWAETPYLAVVGPAPLRFLPPFKPHTNIVVLTPPMPAQPVVPVVAEKIDKTPVAPTPAPAPAHPVEQSNPNVAPAQPDGVVSPQMLLKYFGKSTNASASDVSAPLDFTPPHPVEPPSSKAEYSTPPH